MNDKITMSDIRKRLSSVKSEFKKTPNIKINKLYEQAKTTKSVNVVENFLQYWDSMYTNKGQCFAEVMEVFKEFSNNTDNVSDIKKISNIICNDILPRIESTNPIHDLVLTQTRDARNVFKRQLRRNTNYLKDLTDPHSGSIAVKDLNNQNKKTIDGINPLPDETDTSNLLPNKPTEKEEIKEATIIQAYTDMGNVIEMMGLCDRVLSNHNKLSKRFNIDKTVKESSMDIQGCIHELCAMIDTYDNMPFNVKYNVALENIPYVLDKNGVKFENGNVLKDITEYFLYRPNLSEDNKDGMKRILEKTVFYTDRDKMEVEFLDTTKSGEDSFTKFFNIDDDIWVQEAHDYNMKVVNEFNLFKSKADKAIERKKKLLFIDKKTQEYIDKKSLETIISDPDNSIDSIEEVYLAKYTKNELFKIALKNYYHENSHVVKVMRHNDCEHLTDPFINTRCGWLTDHYFADPDKGIFYYINFNSKPNLKKSSYEDIVNASKKECIRKNLIKESYISEVSKEEVKESIKEILDKFKLESNKTIDKVKNVISKVYVRSPEQVIEELPNFLTWFRLIVVFGTFAAGVIPGLVVLFTDQLIAMGLKREQADKAVNSYKKELETAKNKLDKAKDDESKESLEKYVSSLKTNLSKLESHRDNLYTDKELSKRDEVDMADDVSLESAFNNMSVGDYISNQHKAVVRQFKDSLNRIKQTASAKVKQYIYKAVLSFVESDELIKFEDMNSDTIVDYVNPDDNKISMWFAKCLPMNLNNGEVVTRDDMKELYESIHIICERLNDESPKDYIISYDGNDDLIYLYMTYNKPIHFDDPSQKDNGIHKMIEDPINTVIGIGESIVSLKDWDPSNIMGDIASNIDKFGMDEIDSITEFSIISPDIINQNKLKDILNEYKSEVYQKPGSDKYIIADCLASNIYKLNNTDTAKHNIMSVSKAINEMEAIDSIYSIMNESRTLYEGSATNTIKLASERLKKVIINLSDKEKMASRNLDSSLNVFAKKVQDAATDKNRENVIKGQVIPSASKSIKLAITAAAAWAVNPAIAVIGALATIGLAKGASKKQRQMILDEIDIELQICDKRIQMAESNNDMKSLTQLLKIQKKLEREKQRLKYRMKVYYKDDAPDSSALTKRSDN